MPDINLIEPLDSHRIDTGILFAYLQQHIEGFHLPATLLQFQGGQSNPTFLVSTSTNKYVLRKKPPGTLVQSAHQIEREFLVQNAIIGTCVPVPRMYLFCSDKTIIGTEFYVMEYLDGRIITDVAMKDLPADERRHVHAEVFLTMAKLHSLDYESLGLQSYGKPKDFLARQISRWRRQYDAIQSREIPEFELLFRWLSAHIPDDGKISIVHGDLRLGNAMLHKTEPRIIAILDWELSTLGHPLVDLAHGCMAYHLPQSSGLGLPTAHGLHSEDEILRIYSSNAKYGEIQNWPFFLGFSLFRMASITEGIYSRALQGNAANENAFEMQHLTQTCAEAGWQIVRKTAL